MLATEPGNQKVKIPVLVDEDVRKLESEMDNMDTTLAPMKFFVLPGGHPSVSICHVCRTVCRRAERLVTALHESEPTYPLILKYLNRLSDYLFVLARKMTMELKVT
jgi:cob(I)alamin adenosyltransferase